jgi:hypothetical protein
MFNLNLRKTFGILKDVRFYAKTSISWRDTPPNKFINQAAYMAAGLTLLLTTVACVDPPPPPSQPKPPQSRSQGIAPQLAQRPDGPGLYQERKSNDGSPPSFVTAAPNTWEKVQYRAGLSSLEVHNRANSVAAGFGFAMDEISQNDLYGRSHWNNTFASKGTYRSDYRIRVQWKVLQDEGNLQFRVEAQFKPGSGNWIDGTDSDAIKDIRDDLILRLR